MVRGRRRYELCGAGLRRRQTQTKFLWLPSAAFFIVIICSAFALASHTPEAPSDVQRELPLARVAHYTAEDFFTAAR